MSKQQLITWIKKEIKIQKENGNTERVTQLSNMLNYYNETKVKVQTEPEPELKQEREQAEQEEDLSILKLKISDVKAYKKDDIYPKLLEIFNQLLNADRDNVNVEQLTIMTKILKYFETKIWSIIQYEILKRSYEYR